MPKKDPHLQKLIDDAKTKKFRDGEAKGLVATIGDEIKAQLGPLFSAHSKEITDSVKGAFKDLKIDVPKQDAPQVHMPDFPQIPPFPEQKAPVVNVPAPIVNIPAPVVHVAPSEVNFPESMSLRPGVKPFPVIMMDQGGKPMQFPQMSSGATGGRGDFFTIKDIQNSTGGSIIDSDGFVKVAGSFSVTASNSSTQVIDSSGVPYNAANPFPVSVSGAGTTTTSLVNRDGLYYNSDNPLPVTDTTTDVAPATQNITTQDLASSTATGANNQSIIIGTPTAGSAATFTLASIETVRVEVTGIWTGTIAAEQSIDGGTTWVSQGLHQGAYTTSTFTAGFIGGGNVAGATQFRMRATAAITGTVVVKVIESFNTQSVYVANAAPSGTVISTNNSSSATLTSGSVFTGTGEDVTNFSEMRISVFSDVASATDGLSIQQSTNNTNWDITDTYTISAATGKTFVVPRQARYMRVVYTNGGTNQASFRLQAILNRTATAPSSQRATDGYSNETDLVQGQSFGMLFNESTWDRARNGPGLSTFALRTVSAVDVVNSVYAQNPAGPGESATALRVLLAGDSVSSVVVNSGTITTVTAVTGITNSVSVALVDSTGVQYSGSNPLPVDTNDSIAQGDSATALRVVIAGNSDASVVVNSGTITTVTTLTSVTNSIAAALVDSSNVQYSGSNPLPVTVSGALSSTVILLTRQSNPTAVAADYVPQAADDLGRTLTRPIQVRDLIKTAYATSSTGIETTLLAGVAGAFLDLVMITATNASSVAVQVDIRATTAGSIIHTMYIPATTGPVGWSPQVPWPQDNQGNAWTFDVAGADVSNTNVYITGLFTQEI